MKNNQFKIPENAQVHENFRTWKSGKKWLYASSILALLVSGGAIASSSQSVFAAQVLSTSTGKTTGADNATVASSASDTKSAAQSAANVASSASDTKSAAQSAATVASSASDTKSAAQSAATVASSASDTKSAAQSAATVASSDSDTKSAAQSAATVASSDSDTKSAAQSAATVASSDSDTKSAVQSAATVASSDSDTKSAVQSAATVASSDSDTKSAVQSAATVASSDSDTKSAVQSAATVASSDSDTKSVVQPMADDATSQKNPDGKTQYSSLNNAQTLSFKSNSQDSNAPTATGVNLTGTYTQANLPQQFKNDGMTGDTFWLYSGADLLKKNVSITKHWANAGSINGRNVDFHETFHDFVAQNNPGADGISSITGVDKQNPYLILISSNAVDNIDVYNANFQETFWFTYSDDKSIVDITKFDQAHAAQNNNQIFYFLSASLSSNNGGGSNRREYVQTKDAKTVVISKNPINDPSTGFTAPASTMGLTSVSGTNVPDGLVYTNTDPSGYQSHDGEDSNPYYYALQGGVTFADFTSNQPTLYLGAVPISNSNIPWWAHSNWWWHGNHNKNSDFLSFVTYSIFNNKKVNETINYVDQTGKTVAPSYTANPITFITVKAWNGTTTYYKFGSQEDPTLDNAGKPDSSWIQADNAKFGAIDNPTVKGYKVISTTAPGSDLNSVAIQTVNNTSDDLNFTVVYAKNAPTITTDTKTVNPSQPTTPAKPVNPSQPATPTKPVQAGQAAATNFVDQRLPQTGETDQQHMTLSGLLLLAMSSLLGLFGMTKRQRKE